MAATTRGLRSFTLPEVDHLPSGEDAEAVYNRLINLSTYLLTNGPMLKSGDTIGIGPGVQGRIAHRADLDQYQLTVTQ